MSPEVRVAKTLGRQTPARDLFLLILVVVGLLSLFLGKAFTIDDPLFLWLAEHVQEDPLDFFGFEVNWYGTSMPMHEVTKNPPLMGYLIAAAASVVGWGEFALHLVFLLPAAAAAAATYLLARRLCSRPLEASLIGLLTPAFLVSSTNVMCDTTLVAFWCGSIWCWLMGFDRHRWPWLFAAGVLALLAGLTKYFGLALVPLLLLHGAVRKRRLGAWSVFLLVPVLGMLSFESATRSLYGSGMLLEAAGYATSFKEQFAPSFARQALVGLVYAGGCFLPALFFAPFLWPRRALIVGAIVVVLGVAGADGLGTLLGAEAYGIDAWSPLSALQLALLALGGVSMLALVASDAWHGRDNERWLLAAWVLGSFVFASFVNWTNNARSMLPLAPALGILLVRRLEWRSAAGRALDPRRCLPAFAAGVAVALLVAWADYRWANDVRETARSLAVRYVGEDRVTFFVGHWGFQYYMEQGGARAMDWDRDGVLEGQLLIRPTNNTEVPLPPSRYMALLEETFQPGWLLATMSPRLGANFYSSTYAALPFAFGPEQVDRYEVWQATQAFRHRDWRRPDGR